MGALLQNLVPKLKFEHVRLTSFSKMRVDLAAQVGISLYERLVMTCLIMCRF